MTDKELINQIKTDFPNLEEFAWNKIIEYTIVSLRLRGYLKDNK